MSELQDLMEIMAPPKKPFNSKGNWEEIERLLGIELPGDYKEFVETYGDGVICDYICVLNPFSTGAGQDLLSNYATRLRTQWQLERVHNYSRDLFPFSLYPAAQGVLLWGTTTNGDELFWRIKGSPESWDVVIQKYEWKLVKNVGFSACLLKILKNRLKQMRIPRHFFRSGPHFVPIKPDKTAPRLK